LAWGVGVFATDFDGDGGSTGACFDGVRGGELDEICDTDAGLRSYVGEVAT
jgi:hypothetical protein